MRVLTSGFDSLSSVTPQDAPITRQSSSHASCRIELFGKFRITRGAEVVATVNTNRLRSLLAYLILQGDAPQSREHLAFLLWPDSDEPQARTNLRQLIHHLRRVLPDECGRLETDNQTVYFRRSPVCGLDVTEFDVALAAAQRAAHSGDFAAERFSLERAASLYQDDLLPALYDDWLQQKRDQYRQIAGQVLARLAAILEQSRDFSAAIRYAERLVALDHLREPHHQLLIRLHTVNRDRASALRAYHQCMRILRRELGVEPSEPTRALFETALKSDLPTRAPAEAPSALSDLPLPLVGRRTEWLRLIDFWKSVSTRGIRLVVIPGEPGIGKSRLAEELYAWCKQRQAALARARCYAAQGRLAYAPLAEWLRSESLRAACDQLPYSQIAELARVLPEILARDPSIPKPKPLTESWERRHFYDALNAVFSKVRKPLLLVIDDLQWCDPDSFEWLHSLFRAEHEGGILVLTTLRSGDTDRNHPFARLWSELRQTGQADEIALQPLDAEETAALGCQIAKRQLTDAELSQLYRSTQGNPLFVVETIRAGLAKTAGGAAPPRVHAVIVARLSQLAPAAYELAGFAATAGQAFSFDLLAKATDWDEDSLSRALDELWRRRIIERKGAGVYDFTHDRLREVAYAEVSPVRQRFLHRRLARALEEFHAGQLETVYGQIAAHYAAAEMPDEAIHHFREAAGVARQRFADGEAAAALRRAIALCRDLPDSTRRKRQELELLLALDRTLFTTAGYSAEEVGDTSARALALFRELKATELAVPVLTAAWAFYQIRANLGIARELCEELLQLLSEANKAIDSMTAHLNVAVVNFHTGQFQIAESHTEKAIAELDACTREDLAQVTIPEIGALCRAYSTHVLWHLGYADLALKRSCQTIASAGESHPFGSAIALNYAAMLHAFRGESAQAQVLAQQASDICGKYNFAYYRSMAEIVAGWARVMERDSQAGLSQLRNGIALLKSLGAELRLPFYHALLAEAYARAGQRREAFANISTGLAFQSKNSETWAAPYLHQIHGDLLLDDGNRAEARVSYQRALESAEQSGALSLALRSAVRMCRIDIDPGIRQTLETLYGRFTDGLETPDLREARSLLSSRPERQASQPALDG